MDNQTINREACQVIDRLGGTTKTAMLCDVSAQAVSQWRTNGIPKLQRKVLSLTHPEVFAPAQQPESQPQ